MCLSPWPQRNRQRQVDLGACWPTEGAQGSVRLFLKIGWRSKGKHLKVNFWYLHNHPHSVPAHIYTSVHTHKTAGSCSYGLCMWHTHIYHTHSYMYIYIHVYTHTPWAHIQMSTQTSTHHEYAHTHTTSTHTSWALINTVQAMWLVSDQTADTAVDPKANRAQGQTPFPPLLFLTET